MILCERCAGLDKKTPATVKITYGLYEVYRAGRPHHVVLLCLTCAKVLWDGGDCAPLKRLVAAGLSHFVAESVFDVGLKLHGD